MSKKRNNSGQRTFAALRSARAIPDGYYSGDKPNPNLRRFVEENATPYDHDFKPSKTKVEKADIDTVVGEFRKFLETALDGDARAESTIVEIR
jgi:hypothetical protein